MDQFDGAGGVQRLPASQTASPRGQQREQGAKSLARRERGVAHRLSQTHRFALDRGEDLRQTLLNGGTAAFDLKAADTGDRTLSPDSRVWRRRRGLLQKHGRLAAVIRIESHATLTRNRPRRAIGHGNVRIARCAGHLRATAGPTLSATTAPRAPSGFGGPCVVSWAVWCSSSALSSAPISMIVTESQSHVMNTTMAASEP